MTVGRWIAVVVLLLFGVYAWRGGVFTTSGYRHLEQQEADETLHLQHLKRQVDSMRAFRDSLANDPRVQERVAREHWGMVRPGEISILIGTKDSVKRDSVKK